MFSAPLHCGLRVSGSWLSQLPSSLGAWVRGWEALHHTTSQECLHPRAGGSFQKPKLKRMRGELTSGTDVTNNLFKRVLAFRCFFAFVLYALIEQAIVVGLLYKVPCLRTVVPPPPRLLSPVRRANNILFWKRITFHFWEKGEKPISKAPCPRI